MFTTKYSKKIRKYARGGTVIDEEEGRGIYEARPTASFGGRSIIETNFPELGPSEPELRKRMKDFERRKK